MLIIYSSLVISADGSQIKQGKVTWTFSNEHISYGTYINNENWIVGPVELVHISPEYVDGKNGSMVNIEPGNTQGFDIRMQHSEYNEDLNVSKRLPIELKPGDIIVTAVSLNEKSESPHAPYIESYSILIVVEEPPPVKSFRPSYINGDFSHPWSEKDIDYGKLLNLDITDIDLPPIQDQDMSGLIMEMDTRWTGRYKKSLTASPNYGRDLANWINTNAILLNSNFSNEEKRQLLIGMIQYGIDINSIINVGGQWNHDGGHNNGRLLPLVIAAATLNSLEMEHNINTENSNNFQETQQTFYVNRLHIDTPPSLYDGRKRLPYTMADIGKPEWGVKPMTQPELNANNWDARYRSIASSNFIISSLLIELLGFKNILNNPSFFDYTQRYINYRLNRFSDESYYNGYDDGTIFSPITDEYRLHTINDIPKEHLELYLRFENLISDDEINNIRPHNRSLRFPSNNFNNETIINSGYLLQPTDMLPIFFGSDGSLFIVANIPRHLLWDNAIYGIAGNGGSGPDRWKVEYASGAYHDVESRGRIIFTMQDKNGISTRLITDDLSADDVLIIVERKNDEMNIKWIDINNPNQQGVSESVRTETLGTNGNRTEYWGIGAATSNMNFSYSSTGSVAFTGEIDSIGYINTTAPMNTWLDIIKGKNPTLEFQDELKYYRRLNDKNTISLSSRTPLDLSGSLLLVETGTGIQTGSSLLPESSDNHITINKVPYGYIYPLLQGENSKIINFSGTARLNGMRNFENQVQVRLLYENGDVHKNWTSIGSVIDGKWEGEIEVPLSENGWLIIEARIQHTNILSISTSRFSTGYKFAILGQSQVKRFFKNNTIKVQSTEPDLFTFTERNIINGHNNSNLILSFIDPKTPSGLLVLSNQIQHYQGNNRTPISFVSISRPGVGIKSLLSKNDTKFDWDEVVEKNNFLGKEYTGIILQWGSSDVRHSMNYGLLLDELTYGSSNTENNNYLYDSTAFSNTPPLLLSPFTRQSTQQEGPFESDNHHRYGLLRDSQYNWFIQNNLTIGPQISDLPNGPRGGPHQYSHGDILIGQRVGELISRHLNISSSSDPYLTNITTYDSEPNIATVHFNLPNSGRLITSPGHENNITGFEISYDNGLNWSRNGFSAKIKNNSVLIELETENFSSETYIRYMFGGPLSYGTSLDEKLSLQGVLYEEYEHDVLNIGIPIIGSNKSYKVQTL